MTYAEKSRDQLIAENKELRCRLARIEGSASGVGGSVEGDERARAIQVAGATGSCRDVTDRKRVEEALRQSEAKYRTLIESLPDGVFVQVEDRIAFANSAMANLFGAESPDALQGTRVLDLVHPLHRDAIRERIVRNLEIGEPVPLLEQKLVRLDGTVFDAEAAGAAVLYEGRNARQVLVRDITERKRGEEALRDSERRFRMIYELAPVMIHSIDRGAIIRNVNRKWLREMGYERKEVIGRHVDVILTPESRGIFHDLLPKFWNEGEISDVPYQYVTKDGTILDVMLDSIAVSDNEWGEVSISVIRNVTEQKKAEEALRRSEATLRTLLDAAPIGIGHVTGNRTLGWTNQMLCIMLGYSGEELEGQNARIVYESDEEFLRVGKVKHAEVLRSGKGTVETRFRRKDGSIVDVLLSSASIVPGDLSQGLVFTVLDITERKKLEEQLLRSQKMEALGTLAGGIAHDFNNLLQVIGGYADLALFDLDEGEAAYSEMKEIRAAARSAGELTRSLLTFSRRVESSLKIVNLNRVVEHSVRLLRRTIPKMINIELRLSEDIRPVMADPAQLQQVVMNLAVNARDAMEDVGNFVLESHNVHLGPEYCRVHAGPSPGDYAVLAVSDTGCGMERKVADRIFEPFFTTKEVGKGTGLGLATVYGIVQNHGGSIVCYSEPGHGTTFKIYLPVAAELGHVDGPEQRLVLVGGRETVLLVDDEESVRKLGETILKRFGYAVLTASNGRDGLEVFRLEKERIDLVILDLIMPEMGGRECLHEILKIAPATRVIIASGYAANGQIDAALGDGAKAAIRKPYEARQLLDAVRTVLDQIET
ncbi:MAG: PAS domain S-box protein [Pseudomonadota bacterium]